MNVFTDGSFQNGKAVWGFVVFNDQNQKIHAAKGVIDNPKHNEGRQIAGECQAVLQALNWAKLNNQEITIYYDYVGLKNWVADFWGEKPWKTNKEYPVSYRQNFFLLTDHLIDMVWVKGHAGNAGNEAVDNFIKNSVEK